MKTRIIAAAVLVPILLLLVLVAPKIVAAIVFSLLLGVAAYELLYRTKLLRHIRLVVYSCVMAVAVGMFEGASWGAIFSLVMGIFADMAFVENTVMFTVLFPALAFGSGFISQFFINRRFVAFMGAAFFALLITAAVQALETFAVAGWTLSAVPVVAMQTVWSLPPAALAYFPPAKWIE